jgi:peptidoglycan/LPS O-acetylase OafA/YrhL
VGKQYGPDLRRITTSGNWIPEIDGLRFVAIAAVLLGHIAGQTYFRSQRPFTEDIGLLVNSFMAHAARGVELFFAISGFILAQPFLRQHRLDGKPVSISAYFKRRLTRLEPPYILSLLIYSGALLIHHGSLRSLLPPLMAQMAYFHNFTSLESVNFVTWSLEVEVQFYIIAPLLGGLYAIRSAVVRRGVMGGLIVGSMVISTLTHSRASWNLPGQLQFFMVGFLLADLRADHTQASSRWWDAVSLAAWLAIFLLPAKQNALALPALILIAYLGTFNGPTARHVFRTRWVALTGGMCYSFYLMHMLVISTVFKVTQRWIVPTSFTLSYMIQIVVLGMCVYAFCTTYYIIIERPCMDQQWPRKVLAKLSARVQYAHGLVKLLLLD